MHKSFEIELDNLENLIKNNSNIFSKYNDSSLSYINKVDESALNDMIFNLIQGKINADEIIKAYFPDINPHIFISHSSRDQKTAIKFANYLFSEYGIKSFIDSQIWGHIDNAVRILNDRYSKKEPNIYDYKKSNIISSNIYAMLSVALIKTMDNSDGLIFLKSSNSVSSDKYDATQILNNIYTTESPWIYSEINFSSLLRSKKHNRNNQIGYESLYETASFSFSIDTDHMVSVPNETLLKIINISNDSYALDNLDKIYALFDKKNR